MTAAPVQYQAEIPRASMDTIVVEKQRLVDILQVNRATHRQMFEEALAGYKKRAVELLEEHIERIKAGKVERVYVALPEPADHTDDYDRALANLEWTIFDTVELSAQEFDQYVRDNWRWKQEFLTTNATYTQAGR